MRKNIHHSSGFTLVELVIVVAIVGIMTMMAPRINFSEINNKKRAEVFTNHIGRVLENARNNALFGRSIGTLNPEAWRVSIGLNNSGSILTEYLSGSTWTIYDDRDFSFSTVFPESIRNVNCNDSGDIGTATGIVQFQGRDVSYTGACATTDKIMTIDTSYYGYTGSLNINAVSGVIETND